MTSVLVIEPARGLVIDLGHPRYHQVIPLEGDPPVGEIIDIPSLS